MAEQKKLTALEKVDAELEALRQKRAAIISRESNEQRKLRGRKSAIIGAWLLDNDPAMVAKIISQLTRPQEIAVFAELLEIKLAAAVPVVVPAEPSANGKCINDLSVPP